MAAVAVIFAVLFVAAVMKQRIGVAPGPPVVRFALTDDPSIHVQSAFSRSFALSPDGRTIAFQAYTDSLSPRLWVRSITEPRARPVPGTEGGGNAAFSPDGQWIAFVSGLNEIKKVRTAGGDAMSVVRIEARSAALSWESNDAILFEQLGVASGIQRVGVNGGRPELAIPIDSAAGEISQRRPLVLGKSGIVAYGSTGDNSTLVLYRLSDGRRTRLGISGIGALAMIDDRLVYSRADGTLMAVQLDLAAMKAVGTPVPLEPRVTTATTGTSVGLSEGGTLVYRAADATSVARLQLVDTAGNTRAIKGDFAIQGLVRFSPDGRRLAIGVGRYLQAERVPAYDLWTVDAATGEPTRVTAKPEAYAAAWMPDGKRLVYATAVGSQWEMRSAPVDGGDATRLFSIAGVPYASAVALDGKSVIVATAGTPSARPMLFRTWIDGSARVDTLLAGRSGGVRAVWPRVSPDGRFVAYLDASTYDVYVRSLTGPEVVQVSVSGTNAQPVVWGRDSRSLYYVLAVGLNVIELEPGPGIKVARRRVTRAFPLSDNYDLSPDGKTFAMVAPVQQSSAIYVAVNWADEARRAWRAAEKR
jgi:Tol biopolymer transport system component